MQFAKKTVWFITALILLFYILQATIMIDTFGHPIGLCDFDFHMDKVLGAPSDYTLNCYNADNGDTTTFEQGFKEYPSLIQNVLAGLGVTTQKELFLAMLLIVIVIPVWLFVENVNPLAGFIWLCFSTVHLEILQATIPQAVVVVLFILYFLKFRKNYYILAIFALLSIGLHSEGAYFFAIVIGLELIEDLLIKINFKNKALLATPLIPVISTKSFVMIPEIILFDIPFWLIWITRKAFLNSIVKTGLLLVSIYGTLTINFRIAWIAQVLLTIEIAKEMHAGKIKHERLLLASMVFYLAIELAYFSATNYAFFFQ